MTPGAFDRTQNGENDTFVTEFNAAGSGLVYSTFLGGTGFDEVNAIALDAGGEACVTGWTNSSDFPISQNAVQKIPTNSFLTKFASDGGSVVFSTYVESPGCFSVALCAAVDDQSNVYLGLRRSDDNVNYDVGILKYDPIGTEVCLSRIIGGNDWEEPKGLAIGPDHSIYVSGTTASVDFPVSIDAYEKNFKGGYCDSFLVKLSPAGDLLYATFLGGGGGDGQNYCGVAVRGKADVYVVGETSSTDFPVTAGAFDTSANGGFDVFISRFSFGQKDDLVGIWDGQGIYYRNSETGGWIKLASPAEMIAVGDLDGDGWSDLIGGWSGQGGVWAKSSKNGSWFILSSAARHIAAGDANGDGWSDFFGTWDGQGVYCRNSVGGQWIQMATPADQVAAGDLDGDGMDDLIGTWDGQAGVWVKYSQTQSWMYLGSSAGDIAGGKMSGGTWGSGLLKTGRYAKSLGSAEKEFEPVNGLAKSVKGPGRPGFVFTAEKNLKPVNLHFNPSRLPGPGEPGFRWSVEKNLSPLEGTTSRTKESCPRLLDHP